MKRIGFIITAVAMVVILSACRGNKSTYTTPTTTAMTTAMTTAETTQNAVTQTPTINNGNGPVTTAAAEDNATENTVDNTMDNTMDNIMATAGTNN